MGQTFEELIGSHLDGLYSAALCFTLDELQAEELLQEASIRAFHEYGRRGRGGDFRSEMLAVLVSTYLQRQRRQGRDPLGSNGVTLDEVLEAGLPGREVQPFPEPGSRGHRLLMDWISRVWTELDDGDRLVLWLADIEGLRHARVAEMVGLSREEVLGRHYRARLMLSRGARRVLSRQASGGTEA